MQDHPHCLGLSRKMMRGQRVAGALGWHCVGDATHFCRVVGRQTGPFQVTICSAAGSCAFENPDFWPRLRSNQQKANAHEESLSKTLLECAKEIRSTLLETSHARRALTKGATPVLAHQYLVLPRPFSLSPVCLVAGQFKLFASGAKTCASWKSFVARTSGTCLFLLTQTHP